MSEMPKRSRQQSVSTGCSENDGDTCPSPPAPTHTTPQRDPELQRELDRLQLDDDFKESIWAMSPNTRREVLNDIVRNQQYMLAQEALNASPGLSARAVPPVEDAGSHVLNESDEWSDEGEADTASLVSGDPFTPLNAMLSLLGSMDRLGGSLEIRRQLVEILAEAHQISTMHSMGIHQDIDEMTYEQLLELGERIGSVNKGLSREQIPSCMTPLVGEPAEGSCAVCLEEWQREDDSNSQASKRVTLNACGHIFHGNCIEQWLLSNKTCPVCKQEVTSASPPR